MTLSRVMLNEKYEDTTSKSVQITADMDGSGAVYTERVEKKADGGSSESKPQSTTHPVNGVGLH